MGRRGRRGDTPQNQVRYILTNLHAHDENKRDCEFLYKYLRLKTNIPNTVLLLHT